MVFVNITRPMVWENPCMRSADAREARFSGEFKLKDIGEEMF